MRHFSEYNRFSRFTTKRLLMLSAVAVDRLWRQLVFLSVASGCMISPTGRRTTAVALDILRELLRRSCLGVPSLSSFRGSWIAVGFEIDAVFFSGFRQNKVLLNQRMASFPERD